MVFEQSTTAYHDVNSACCIFTRLGLLHFEGAMLDFKGMICIVQC